MSEFLSKLNSEDAIALVSICGGMLFVLALIGMRVWHKVRTEEIAADLKKDMLDRGMSPDEIKTVLEVGPKK
jgi:hypothetical protein